MTEYKDEGLEGLFEEDGSNGGGNGGAPSGGFEEQFENVNEMTLDDEVVDERNEEIDSFAMSEAQRKREIEDIQNASKQIEEDEKKMNQGYNDWTLEQELDNMDRDVAKAFETITPFKEFVYNTANKTLGVNLYRNIAVKHKNKLMKRKLSLEKTVAEYKAKLNKEDDTDKNVEMSSKGLEAQNLEYKSICRGTSHAIQRIDSSMRSIQKEYAKNEANIKKYLNLVEQDGNDEENTNMLKLYQTQAVDLKNDVAILQKERKVLGTKLKNYNGLDVTIELQCQNYQMAIEQGEEGMMTLQSHISLIDQYLDAGVGAMSLAKFQKSMSSLQTEIDKSGVAIGTYQVRSAKALEKNIKNLRKSSPVGKFSGYLDNTKSIQSRLLAEEDQKVNELVDHYLVN